MLGERGGWAARGAAILQAQELFNRKVSLDQDAKTKARKRSGSFTGNSRERIEYSPTVNGSDPPSLIYNLFFLFARPPNAAHYLTLNLYQISYLKREELARAV